MTTMPPPSGCEGVVRGDPRSPNGANQHGECFNRIRYVVTEPSRGVTIRVCGLHVRRFRRMNVLLDRPMYQIADVPHTCRCGHERRSHMGHRAPCKGINIIVGTGKRFCDCKRYEEEAS